ncbi:MAG: 1-aminocyclopropane-1-carboxylate deaminase [Cryomorphaceae bacterium]|jgi:1-aminocyclopropane-1-carboxylate deaminase/D-cysteine desulfhydrase-like pyridoxal-dependent ACC family enzyme
MSSDGYWPLFDTFPRLQARLAPISLCALPTPVEQLKKLGEQVWVKRDDTTHLVYGGNKTRKFEFIIPEVVAAGAKHIYTIGGTGTNHGVATAMVCQQLGLKSTIIAFDQPNSPYVQKNQALMKHFGAEVLNSGSIISAASRFYLNPRRLSSEYYFLPAGGAVTVAIFSYINAALELKKQIDSGECPEPDEVYVPVGSSTTLAGLTLGCAIAGMKTKVIGIQIMQSNVGPLEVCTPAISNKMMQQALAVIASEYPDYAVVVASVILKPQWYEPGYGVLTNATEQAIKKGKELGLVLDQTYSGKAFDAFTQSHDSADKPTLYWATYSSSANPAELDFD